LEEEKMPTVGEEEGEMEGEREGEEEEEEEERGERERGMGGGGSREW
jgi:hypothetical protein